jgi:hypothetical protein
MITMLARWYAFLRDAGHVLIYGPPQPPPTEHGTEDLAPAHVDDVGEEKCQQPTPGSYGWVSRHDFFGTKAGLLCGRCGLSWPEERVHE